MSASRAALLLAGALVVLPPPPAPAQTWADRTEGLRLTTAAILETVEEMPGPHASPAARDRWDRFSRAVGLEAARSWAVMARFGFAPPSAEGVDDWARRGSEERFVRRNGPWERRELRVLAARAFDDLATWMAGLDGDARRTVDRSSGLTQEEWLAGLGPTFAAKLEILQQWVRASGEAAAGGRPPGGPGA